MEHEQEQVHGQEYRVGTGARPIAEAGDIIGASSGAGVELRAGAGAGPEEGASAEGGYNKCTLRQQMAKASHSWTTAALRGCPPRPAGHF